MSLSVEAEGLALRGRLETTSLALRAGELTCLVGPNGSGKTSLLHALAGVGQPSGSVRIGGEDPRRASPSRRMKLLSYLPASRDVHWPVTARDLVALGCAHEGDRARIPEVLERMRLDDFADRRIDRMSTGERSRVLIARALAADAKLILLDEPAANLDPLWQLRLMEMLKGIAARDEQCVLVAMHDLGLARRYADRLIVMNEGRIVADGASAAIFTGQTIRDVFGIEERDGRWMPAD